MSARLFTTEQEAEIVRRYAAGESSEVIAGDIIPGRHVDGITVRNVLKRCDVVLRKAAHESNPVVTDEQRERLVVLCRDEGYTLQEAADEVGVSKKTASRAVCDAGMHRVGGKPRTCEVNDAAFDVLTPESLYWIGFLFADGNVHQDVIKGPRKSRATAGSPALNVGLSVVDRGHLEKLRTFLGSTHKISDHPAHDSAPTSKGGPIVNTGPSVYLSVRSKQLCAALRSYGIVSKGDRVPVSEVAASRDFWRGMVDGDGSLGTYTSGGYTYVRVRLAGQIALLGTFSRFLVDQRLARLNVSKEEHIWTIGTTGAPATAIIKFLYENACESLDRKAESARLAIEHQSQQQRDH